MRPPAYTRVTVMRFSVRVPVLSEQITEVAPRVSAAGSLRISALRLAITTPDRARMEVTSAGSISGMAATTRETAPRKL